MIEPSAECLRRMDAVIETLEKTCECHNKTILSGECGLIESIFEYALRNNILTKLKNNEHKAVVYLDKLIALWNEYEGKHPAKRFYRFPRILEFLMDENRYDLIERIFAALRIDSAVELLHYEDALIINTKTKRVIEMFINRMIKMVCDVWPYLRLRQVSLLKKVLIDCTRKNFLSIALSCIEALNKVYLYTKPQIGRHKVTGVNVYLGDKSLHCEVKATLELALIISHLYKHNSIKQAISKFINIPAEELRYVFTPCLHDIESMINARKIDIEKECEFEIIDSNNEDEETNVCPSDSDTNQDS